MTNSMTFIKGNEPSFINLINSWTRSLGMFTLYHARHSLVFQNLQFGHIFVGALETFSTCKCCVSTSDIL